MVSIQRDPESIHAQLTEWVQAKLPASEDVRLSPLEKPGLGFSNETWFAELSWREDGKERSEDLVFRLEPAGFFVFPEYDLPEQVRVMQSLGSTDIPVPEILWLEEDRGVVGCPFYVMKKIEGRVPPDVPNYHAEGVFFDATLEARAKMWGSGIETLAGIHTLDWESLGFSFLEVPEAGTGPLDRQLDYYDRYLEWAREGEPQPVLEASLRWLRENRYAPKRVTLCWGDSRLPNLIYRDDEVVGVLDWEMAFLGDPEADLAWWLFLDWHHSDGNGTPRLEGFPAREETIRRYEELTGWKTENLFYQEVMAAFRFGASMGSLFQNMSERGISVAGTTTPTTRRLASLLDLPIPDDPSDLGG